MTVLITTLLIVGSAFFVMVEFSLMASRRYRLEEAARTSSAGRAALRNASDLTLMLAGAQLGITLCTLALGAFTKPAVKEALTPLFASIGVPAQAASIASFVLALVLVTFLHLVVGEMAPKSWAVAHPERSAIMLALPMRAFMFLTRPLLHVLNSAANACLRMVKVEPVDEVDQAHTPEDLQQLLEHSAQAGTLERESSDALLGALELTRLSLDELVSGRPEPTAVGPDATAGEVREASRRDRHRRVLVRTEPGGSLSHVVHVRDVLGLAEEAPIAEAARPVTVLDGAMTVVRAFEAMRGDGVQLALVERGEGRRAVVTVTDVLTHLLTTGQVTSPS